MASILLQQGLVDDHHAATTVTQAQEIEQKAHGFESMTLTLSLAHLTLQSTEAPRS